MTPSTKESNKKQTRKQYGIKMENTVPEMTKVCESRQFIW